MLSGGVPFRARHGAGVDELLVVLIGVHDPGQAELLDVAQAYGPLALLPGSLHRRYEDGHEDGDDGDHHQQLDECECP